MARVLVGVKALTEGERAFLENPYVGVVTEVRAEGSLRSTVVGLDVDDGDVSFNTAWPRVQPRDLQAHPKVADRSRRRVLLDLHRRRGRADRSNHRGSRDRLIA